jgi:hypothetical protein
MIGLAVFLVLKHHPIFIFPSRLPHCVQRPR